MNGQILNNKRIGDEIKMFKKKSINRQNWVKKFTSVLIMILLFGTLIVGDAKVIKIIDVNEDSELIFDDEIEVDVIRPDNKRRENEFDDDKGDVRKKEPTITIGSINAEHRDDPDYITYEIKVESAYYFQEVDGVKVKKPIPNIVNGTISVPREK